jgi:hypothetical protein
MDQDRSIAYSVCVYGFPPSSYSYGNKVSIYAITVNRYSSIEG